MKLVDRLATIKRSRDERALAHTFLVATYGTSPGFTGAQAKRLLSKRDLTIEALFSVKMPDNRKPAWVKERCVMCLGCLHRCPKFAIQYEGGTREHGQYRHRPRKTSSIMAYLTASIERSLPSLSALRSG